jgi:hypothetical protein
MKEQLFGGCKSGRMLKPHVINLRADAVWRPIWITPGNPERSEGATRGERNPQVGNCEAVELLRSSGRGSAVTPGKPQAQPGVIRIRRLRRRANTAVASAAVETRCIASPCGGEWRHPAGSPGTMGTTGTVGTIPVTELAKNTAVSANRPCEELRGTKQSKPETTGMVGTIKIVGWTASYLAP